MSWREGLRCETFRRPQAAVTSIGHGKQAMPKGWFLTAKGWKRKPVNHPGLVLSFDRPPSKADFPKQVLPPSTPLTPPSVSIPGTKFSESHPFYHLSHRLVKWHR